MSETSIQFESAEEEAAFVASIEEARKSLDEGRFIPWEDVRRWLLSWGTEDELPPPECR